MSTITAPSELETLADAYVATVDELFAETDADRAEELNDRAVALGVALAEAVGADPDAVGDGGGDLQDWVIPGAVEVATRNGNCWLRAV